MAPPPAGRSRGTVSRWTDRGFGFITPEDGGEDLFCHFSNIDDGNGLEPGAVVEFVKVYDDRKGKERAEQVTGGVTTERNMQGGYGGGGGFGGGGGGSRGICFDWQKGQCTRGDACRFSHGEPPGNGMGYGGMGGGQFGVPGGFPPQGGYPGGPGGAPGGYPGGFPGGPAGYGGAPGYGGGAPPAHGGYGAPPAPGGYGVPQPAGGYGAPQGGAQNFAGGAPQQW